MTGAATGDGAPSAPLGSEDLPDPVVTVQLVDGTELVTKSSLVGLSPFFDKALAGTSPDQQVTLKLSGATLSQWNVMWRFYKTAEANVVTIKNAPKAVAFSALYCLPRLREHCDKLITANCRFNGPSHVWEMLNWAIKMNMTQLKNLVMKMIRENFVRYTEEPLFLKVSQSVIHEILEGPLITADRMYVKQAINKWNTAQPAIAKKDPYRKVSAFIELFA